MSKYINGLAVTDIEYEAAQAILNAVKVDLDPLDSEERKNVLHAIAGELALQIVRKPT